MNQFGIIHLRRTCDNEAREILRIGFELLEGHRVFAKVDTENIGSIKVSEKLSMTREGMFRQSVWSPAHGSWRDIYHNAILEDARLLVTA